MAKPKRLKKISASIYLEQDQDRKLRLLSKLTRVSQQAYLREGVEYILAKYSANVTA